jgi:putative FmdB family regulatory protein
MPTYDYECEACKHTFEEFQAMKDEPLKKCPKCKKQKLRRLFGTGGALLFKGEGFYITDYRSESYKAAAKKESDSAGKSAGADSKASGGGDATAKAGADSSKSKSKSSDG